MKLSVLCIHVGHHEMDKNMRQTFHNAFSLLSDTPSMTFKISQDIKRSQKLLQDIKKPMDTKTNFQIQMP